MAGLQNKIALVTGAAQGIGLAIAKRFTTDGATVVLADLNRDAGAAAAGELAKNGAKAHFMACDVADPAACAALLAQIIKDHGRLDVLVNNAAIIDSANFLDLDLATFDRILGVNLRACFVLGQAAGRQMVAQLKAGGAPGTIINMSSVNDHFALPDHVAYTVAKGGVRQLTRAMAVALAPHGIRVNAIGPGSILTPLLANVVTDDAARRKILSRTPLGRIGQPEEVAAVAAFLAGPDASYITGETIYCDGGRIPLNYTVPVAD
jgi:glucose 1-dehydrogenase